ncbi:MAG: dynamin family protein [Sulfobacillus sp.]
MLLAVVLTDGGALFQAVEIKYDGDEHFSGASMNYGDGALNFFGIVDERGKLRKGLAHAAKKLLTRRVSGWLVQRRPCAGEYLYNPVRACGWIHAPSCRGRMCYNQWGSLSTVSAGEYFEQVRRMAKEVKGLRQFLPPVLPPVLPPSAPSPPSFVGDGRTPESKLKDIPDIDGMSRIPVVGVCGQVSSGKSTLCNALIGLLSSTALRRETFCPVRYRVRRDAPKENLALVQARLSEIREENRASREGAPVGGTPPKVEDIPWEVPALRGIDFDLIDFPGINDADDRSGRFKQCLFAGLDLCDVVIYVSSAETVFTLQSEVQLFGEILRKIDELGDQGNVVFPHLVINKFDDGQDPELAELRADACKKFPQVPSFAVSGHRMLAEMLSEVRAVVRLPASFRTEMQKMLKTADCRCPASPLLIRSSPVNSTHVPNVGEITFDFSKATFFPDGQSGDWDGLVQAIEALPSSIDSRAFDELRTRLVNRVGTWSYLQLHRLLQALIARCPAVRLEELADTSVSFLRGLKARGMQMQFINAFKELPEPCQRKVLGIAVSEFGGDNLVRALVYLLPETSPALRLLASKPALWQPVSITVTSADSSRTEELVPGGNYLEGLSRRCDPDLAMAIKYAQMPYWKLKLPSTAIEKEFLPALDRLGPGLRESVEYRLQDASLFCLSLGGPNPNPMARNGAPHLHCLYELAFQPLPP